MKKLIDETIIKNLFERWNIVLSLRNDGSKYGSSNDEAYVHNDCMGHVRVSEVKELEKRGAITFHKGYWKIKCDQLVVDSLNKSNFHVGRYIGETLSVPTKAWYEYEESKKYRVMEEIEEDREAFRQLSLDNTY